MNAGGAVATLGPLRAADRDHVAEMVAATGVFRTDEVQVALEVFDGAVASPGGDYLGCGVYDADRIRGFALYGHTPCTVGTWDLYWIVVDPSAQGAGLGRLLMAAAEQAVAEGGGRLVIVETSSRREYAPTRAFYEALGYDRVAQIREYYAPGDDLIVYGKHLAPSQGTADHG
jgi:ribosomal protein S18 acetylase RimI-like enzyme